MKKEQNSWKDPLYLEELLTDEEKSLRVKIKDYCQNKLLPKVIECNNKSFFDKSFYPDLGSLGFLGNTIKGYGSANVSSVAYGLVAKELESIDSSYRSAISVQSSLVIHPIFTFGSEEQKKKYIPELIKGNLIGCFGLTESITGSNPSAMETNFKEVSDGYILNGSKNWITNAPIADVFIIWAYDKDKNVHGFILDKQLKGLTTSKIEKASIKIAQAGKIFLKDVKVSKDSILPNTQGWKSVYSCINKARYGIAWGAMGAAETCWYIAKDYTEKRIVNERPLASRQLVQKKLANMLTEVALGFSSCILVGRQMDKGKDLKIAISMLKRNNCRKALDIVRDARDMLGGNGILDEHHIIRHLVNLETVNTYDGTEDTHALILGKLQTGIDAF
ncbi:acyl-CoA dehydrogenase family protein [Pelagibacteraceae bacterium]|nr:acyl-CoA dehydrogenase family protein [Pelagibacteraceae bacterium]